MTTTRKITFRDLYAEFRDQPTPAQSFIAEVAEITRRKINTVIAWTKGQQTPDRLAQEQIAARFGVDIETLCPNLTTEDDNEML